MKIAVIVIEPGSPSFPVPVGEGAWTVGPRAVAR